MIHLMNAILLALVAIHAAMHVRPMLHHARRAIHKFLGLKVGDKCNRRQAMILIALMAAVGCVACAPVLHYGMEAYISGVLDA